MPSRSKKPQFYLLHKLTQTPYTKLVFTDGGYTMKNFQKSPCYLVRNPYSYCFRMIVPKDLRNVVGKTELRYTLKTGYLGIAKNKAKLLAGQVHLVFSHLRKEPKILGKLSNDQIKELVHRYIKDSIESWDKAFYENRDEELPGFRPYEVIDFYEDIRQQLVDGLNFGDFSMFEQPIAEFLMENGVDEIDKESVEYRKLCAEIYKAESQLMPMHKKHMLCDFSYKKQLSDVFPDLFKKPTEKHKVDEEGALLSEVIQNYVAENEKSNWTKKTKQENEFSLNLFLEVLGNVPIKTISRRQVSEFKAVLQKLPPNRNKVKKYRDKTIQELIEMDIDRTLSVSTINKILTRIGSLFKYAIQEGFIEGANPATDMNIPLGKFAEESRAPFTKNDLEKLIKSNEYINDSHKHSYQFWTPIIALFTGIRQDEIAQLHLEDIRQDEEGVWLIDVNDKRDKKVKTKSSRRQVPIHLFLVNDLKLPEYVKLLKGQGETRLFPELVKGRDGYGKSVSRWFNEKYKIKCGIEKDADGRMKDFHSFRTTFINHLQRKRVPFFMLKRVVGHSIGKDVTLKHYTEKSTPKELYDNVMSKIDFGIDLSHLKKSKFVTR